MKSMKKLLKTITIILALAIFCAVGAAAADGGDAPLVRVNGYIVEFPDGQPFIDGNSRTLIPVRFVTEKLGAAVTWDGATQTASITKDGAKVEITIGSPDLRVTKAGKTSTVKMDTAAVLAHDRTYVPIRFVAEQLGAFVDYADVRRTVGIYSDVLTPEQITRLQAYDYTLPTSKGYSYEYAKTVWTSEELARWYGTDRQSFGVYANAREHLYYVRDYGYIDTRFYALGTTLSEGSDIDKYYDYVVREAIAAVGYSSGGVTVEFLADTSCIYQSDTLGSLDAVVRGIAVVTTGAEMSDEGAMAAFKLGMEEVAPNKTYTFPIDVHIYTLSGATGLDKIVRLDETF